MKYLVAHENSTSLDAEIRGIFMRCAVDDLGIKISKIRAKSFFFAFNFAVAVLLREVLVRFGQWVWY